MMKMHLHFAPNSKLRMIKCWLLSYLLLFPILLFSQSEIRNLSDSIYNFQPGSTTSVSFRIENSTSEEKVYDFSIKSSTSSIRPIIPIEKEKYPAHKKTLYIVPLHISAETPPGYHSLSLFLTDSVNGSQMLQTIHVLIATIRDLKITPLSSPNFIKAGELFSSSFVLKNSGNIPEEVRLESKNANIDVPANFILSPGETKLITINKSTNLDLAKNSTQTLDLTVHTTNPKQSQLMASEGVNIIAVKPQDDDIYHRFPISASIAYIGMHERENFQKGFQGELYGKGSLHEKNNALLEFRALTKNPVQYTTFTPYEEYFINYKTDKFWGHLGDKVYSASFLTEYARYGRGAELRFDLGKTSLGGFYNRPRFFQDIKDEFNVFAKYRLNSNSEITAGYLYKTPGEHPSGATRFHIDTESHLPYLMGKTQLFNKVNLLSEFSYSKTAKYDGLGYMIQAEGNFKRFNSSLGYMKTSPTYAGYYNNASTWNGSLNFKITKNVGLHGNYTQNVQNLQRDTLLSVAPYRKYYRYGIDLRYLETGTLSVDRGHQRYSDQLEPQQFNYDEQFLNIRIDQRIKNFQLNLESQFGKTDNHITGFSGNSSYYTASVGFEKFNTSLSLFGSYAQTSRYQLKNQKQIYYGGRMMSRFSKKNMLQIFYQNNYLPEEYFQDRNLFELLFKREISPLHTIDLSGRYTLQRGEMGNKDFIISLRYTARLNIPIKKIANYGSLTGNISNLGVEKTEGIRLILGNHATLTDKSGNYTFKNIVPGDYFLEIDRTTIGLQDIPDIMFPAAVNISSEKRLNSFNFGLTSAAKINGYIHLQETNKKENNAIVADLQKKELKTDNNLIIEISNGEQVFRKICQIGANFDFTYLRPGTWVLKAYKNKLDQRYKIAVDAFHFTLAPTDTKEINIEVLKRQSEIKYQQETIKVGYQETKNK